MIFVRSMRKIHTTNVHPLFSELGQDLNRIAGGTDGADDFSAFLCHRWGSLRHFFAFFKCQLLFNLLALSK